MNDAQLGVATAAIFVVMSSCTASGPGAPTRAVSGSGIAWPATAAGASPTMFAQCLVGRGQRACFGAATLRPAAVSSAAALSAPGNLTAAVSGASVTLTWTASSGGDVPSAYVIEAGSAPGLTDLASLLTATAVTTFQASGVGAGTYYVRVRATVAGTVSAPSNEIVVVVGRAVPPSAPLRLDEDNHLDFVHLMWIAPASGDRPISYLIQAGTSPGASNATSFQTGSSDTSFGAAASGLFGFFYVRVIAINAVGQSAPSNEVLVGLPGHGTCFGPFEPPTGLSASATASTLTLTFTPPATVPGSSVVVAAGTSPGRTDLATFDAGAGPPTVITGVPPGNYFIRVAGRTRDCGVGPFSNEAAVTVR